MPVETLSSPEVVEIASVSPWYGMRLLGGLISSVALTIFDGLVAYNAPRLDLLGKYGAVELLILVLEMGLLVTLFKVYKWTYRTFQYWRRIE